LFGKLLFDLSRERFGEDSSRTGIPEAAAYGMMRFDIGDLSREIAACVPIALVKQFGTRHLQCTACFDAGTVHHDRSQSLACFTCSRFVFLPVPAFNAA
jgi:hypothetical protein